MTRTDHTTAWALTGWEDEPDITVRYSLTGRVVEVLAATNENGDPVELTPAEEQDIRTWALANHQPTSKG